MGRGIAYSFALHAGIVLILLTAASFGTKQKINYDEVVKVTLASLPAKPEPAPIAPPKPAEQKQTVPVDPPKPTAKKVAVDKPKPKEKKQTKPTAKDAKQNDSATADKQSGEANGANAALKGMTVDNATFKGDWWFIEVRSKIESNFRNTVAYDGKLVCTISLRVLKSGRVYDVKVLESSGIQEFDDVCLSAVELSSPFPPLPRDYSEEDIGITVPLSYDPASH